jgi:hypothetical protein
MGIHTRYPWNMLNILENKYYKTLIKNSVNSIKFSSPTRPDRLWSPPSLLTNGYFSLGINWLGREADPEIKNACSYTSNPTYVFMKWCLVKHKENFTFASMKQEIALSGSDYCIAIGKFRVRFAA